MKTKILIIAVLCLVAMTGNVKAQPGTRFAQLRERIANGRFNEIARQMPLDKLTAEKLRPFYLAYEKEKAGLLNGSVRRNLDFTADSLTDEQAEKLYFALLDKAKLMISLREKYYHEFRKVLRPVQIVKFQRIEGEVSRKMLQNVRQKLNQRFPRQE
jgi:hypothetical protein